MNYQETYNKGTLEVVIGPMYSGKTEYLKTRGKRAKDYGQVHVQAFYPKLDTRDMGRKRLDGVGLEQGIDIIDAVEVTGHDQLVIIDEAQFFDESIIWGVQILKEYGMNVVIAGLDKDYRGQPFGAMPWLMALSDRIIKKYSVCELCNKDGTHTQRLRNDKPDSALSPTTIIEGASDSSDKITYEPRCNEHKTIPDLDEYLRRQSNERKIIHN